MSRTPPPLEEAVRVAEDYLKAHSIEPPAASPQLALNALAEWAGKNPDREVGRWLRGALRLPLSEVGAFFDVFRGAWGEYVKERWGETFEGRKR